MIKKHIKLFYNFKDINIDNSLFVESIFDYEPYEKFDEISFLNSCGSTQPLSEVLDLWYSKISDGFTIDCAHSDFVEREEII